MLLSTWCSVDRGRTAGGRRADGRRAGRDFNTTPKGSLLQRDAVEYSALRWKQMLLNTRRCGGLPGPPGASWGLPGLPGSSRGLPKQMLLSTRRCGGLPGPPGASWGLPGLPGSSRGLPGPPGASCVFLGPPEASRDLPGPPGPPPGLPEPPGASQSLPGPFAMSSPKVWTPPSRCLTLPGHHCNILRSSAICGMQAATL